MRLAVVPDGVLERLVLALGLAPTSLVHATWGMGGSRLLFAAVRLGVFDALAEAGEAGLTAEELARATSCAPEGATVLLHALNGFGWIRRRAGRFRNTRETTKWLARSSDGHLVDAVEFLADIWDRLGDLETIVRTGRAPDMHHGDMPEEQWRRYMRGLASMARLPAAEVARRLPFDRPPERILDVGGGHGMFSAALCRKHPDLRAEILDLPECLPHGKQLVEEAGLADRVAFRPGDLRAADWGDGYDAVLLFNILHNLTPEDCRAALHKARGALRPGGRVVVLEAEHKEVRGDLNQAGGVSELLLYVLNGTRAWPEAEMRGWIEAAGLGPVRRKTLLSMPYTCLLIGRLRSS